MQSSTVERDTATPSREQIRPRRGEHETNTYTHSVATHYASNISNPQLDSRATRGAPFVTSATLPQTASIRPDEDRPLIQLSYHMIATYNRINTNYYERCKLSHRGVKRCKKVKEGEDLYPLSEKEEIFNDRYKVYGKRVGMGSFGQVVEGYDMITERRVAIKIVKKKKNFLAQVKTEISILEKLHTQRHSGREMIVRLRAYFLHKGFQCLVFELLSCNLYELLKCNNFRGFGFQFLRKIAWQILKALEYMALPNVDVIHCDLKPENILLVQPNSSKIRIIDFGSSCLSHNQLYEYIQSRFYRAPEVLLGIRYTSAIDMWSLACILVEMHVGKPLFGGKDRYDQMRRIIGTLGMPPNSLIEKSPVNYRQEFFDEISVIEGGRRTVYYRLCFRKDQYAQEDCPSSLADIVCADKGGPCGQWLGDSHHSSHYHNFISLLQRMLDYNPSTRITPTEALKHPFFEPQPPESRTTKKSKCARASCSADDYCGDCCDPPIASNRVKQRRTAYHGSVESNTKR